MLCNLGNLVTKLRVDEDQHGCVEGGERESWAAIDQ